MDDQVHHGLAERFIVRRGVVPLHSLRVQTKRVFGEPWIPVVDQSAPRTDQVVLQHQSVEPPLARVGFVADSAEALTVHDGAGQDLAQDRVRSKE